MEAEGQKSFLSRAWKGKVPQQPGAGELRSSEKKEHTNLWGDWPQCRRPRPYSWTLGTSGQGVFGPSSPWRGPRGTNSWPLAEGHAAWFQTTQSLGQGWVQSQPPPPPPPHPHGLLVPQAPNSTCGQREDRLRSHIERVRKCLRLSCPESVSLGVGLDVTGAPGICGSTRPSQLTNTVRGIREAPLGILPFMNAPS